jgi:hypothetical protein
MTALRDVAEVVRSKNAGPFWLTIDVFFADPERFERGIDSDLSNLGVLAKIYRVDPESILMFAIRELLAIKISLPRPRIQGSFGDTDMHAGQQFVLLLDVEVA